MSDSYLTLAEKAIRHTQRPLHPKEILDVAFEQGIVPSHLRGKTQYKTLAARLSTEIRERASMSPFYRTAANRFYLRDLASEKFTEYVAPRREKTLHNEHVLTLPDGFLKDSDAEGLLLEIDALLQAADRSEVFRYVVRRDAERRFDVKQIISYAIIYRDGKLLTYRRGIFNTAADELQGMRSIGFGGHVTHDDLNLFDPSGHGIVENARRELREELVFDKNESENLETPESFRLLCGLNSYETTEAKKHLAVVIIYYPTSKFNPKKNELSINDLRWTDLSMPETNLDAFEPWSRAILSALYSGELSIDCR